MKILICSFWLIHQMLQIKIIVYMLISCKEHNIEIFKKTSIIYSCSNGVNTHIISTESDGFFVVVIVDLGVYNNLRYIIFFIIAFMSLQYIRKELYTYVFSEGYLSMVAPMLGLQIKLLFNVMHTKKIVKLNSKTQGI